jgi:hypothetical protein
MEHVWGMGYRLNKNILSRIKIRTHIGNIPNCEIKIEFEMTTIQTRLPELLKHYRPEVGRTPEEATGRMALEGANKWPGSLSAT